MEKSLRNNFLFAILGTHFHALLVLKKKKPPTLSTTNTNTALVNREREGGWRKKGG